MGGRGSKTHTQYVHVQPTLDQKRSNIEASARALKKTTEESLSSIQHSLDIERSGFEATNSLLTSSMTGIYNQTESSIQKIEERKTKDIAALKEEISFLMGRQEQFREKLNSHKQHLKEHSERLAAKNNKMTEWKQNLDKQQAELKKRRETAVEDLRRTSETVENIMKRYGATAGESAMRDVLLLLGQLLALPREVNEQTNMLNNIGNYVQSIAASLRTRIEDARERLNRPHTAMSQKKTLVWIDERGLSFLGEWKELAGDMADYKEQDYTDIAQEKNLSNRQLKKLRLEIASLVIASSTLSPDLDDHAQKMNSKIAPVLKWEGPVHQAITQHTQHTISH